MQLIADIVLSLLHENSNVLCHCVLREDRYVPYRPVQEGARMHSKPAGESGSRNTSCMSKDIAVHYFFHV